MSILFYVNLLLLTLVIYFVAVKTTRPRRFAAINVVIAIGYSLVFMSTIGDSHENMLFLVDHYWILALALHWFLLATFFVFRKQPSDL